VRHLLPRPLSAALGLLAVAATLARAGPATAQPEPTPPAEPAPAPPGEPPPAPPPPAVRIVAHTVTGSIDPPDRLESLVRLLAPVGSYHVPPGPVDEVTDSPISTEGRLRQALERLGYDPTVVIRPVAGGVQVDIALQVADRVRQIFVKGNWPFRQEDIIRRLTTRPGQAWPPPGPAMNPRLARYRQSVLTFGRYVGYLAALVRQVLKRGGPPPAPVNLLVKNN
jgi:hypothetical protein